MIGQRTIKILYRTKGDYVLIRLIFELASLYSNSKPSKLFAYYSEFHLITALGLFVYQV